MITVTGIETLAVAVETVEQANDGFSLYVEADKASTGLDISLARLAYEVIECYKKNEASILEASGCKSLRAYLYGKFSGDENDKKTAYNRLYRRRNYHAESLKSAETKQAEKTEKAKTKADNKAKAKAEAEETALELSALRSMVVKGQALAEQALAEKDSLIAEKDKQITDLTAELLAVKAELLAVKTENTQLKKDVHLMPELIAELNAIKAGAVKGTSKPKKLVASA